MIRVLLLLGLFVLAGCNRALRQPGLEVAALIAGQYADAAAHEQVQRLYVRVEGADASDVVSRAQSLSREVRLFSGVHEFEIRAGRFRDKVSDQPCYAIAITLESVTSDSASLRVVSNGSFGGVQVTHFILKRSDGAWKIIEERVTLIS